jgi:hypothetical protein
MNRRYKVKVELETLEIEVFRQKYGISLEDAIFRIQIEDMKKRINPKVFRTNPKDIKPK